MQRCPHLQHCCFVLWGTWKEQLIVLCKGHLQSLSLMEVKQALHPHNNIHLSQARIKTGNLGDSVLAGLFSAKYIRIPWRLDSILSFANIYLTVSCSHHSSCFFLPKDLWNLQSQPAHSSPLEKNILYPSYPILRIPDLKSYLSLWTVPKTKTRNISDSIFICSLLDIWPLRAAPSSLVNTQKMQFSDLHAKSWLPKSWLLRIIQFSCFLTWVFRKQAAINHL